MSDLPLQVIGLHANAEIKSCTETAGSMFEAILAMPSVEDDSALDDDIEPDGRDDIVARKTRCEARNRKLSGLI
jgi:hypothetical protein